MKIILEPRFVFDGAAVATAIQAGAEATEQNQDAPAPTAADAQTGSASTAPTETPAPTPASEPTPTAATPTTDAAATAGDSETEAQNGTSGGDVSGSTATTATAQPDVPAADPAETPDDGESAPVREIVFIDSRVENLSSLLTNVPTGTSVVVLDPARDGLAQITQTLAGRSGISAVHIQSHGSDGWVTLGSTAVNTAILADRGDEVAGWRDALTDGADILIYGCDVAQTETGRQFATTLANLTGADVAASEDPTGAEGRDGDWTLEYATGAIEAGPWADPIALASWDGRLSGPSIAGGTTVTLLEPSTLNASASASTFALSGWTISDDGLLNGFPNDQVTVTVTVGNTAVGMLSGQGSATAVAGGFTFTGTVADANAWLHGLSFEAADAELGNSTSSTSVTIQVQDQESLTATHTIAVTVTPSNDPVLVDNHTMAATEGTSTVVPAAALLAVDPELAAGTQQASQIVFRLTATPTNGYLTLNGAVIGVGSVFTYKNVQDGLLRYHHTRTGAGQNDPDGFSVSVNDGATPQANSDTATVSITITPVNQAPTAGGSGLVFEGQPANATSSGVPQSQVGTFITATDGGDPGDSLSIRITSLTTHGKLYFTGTATLNGTTQSFTNLDLSTLGNGDGDLNDTGESFVIAYDQRAGLTYANDGVDPGGVPPNDSFGIEVSDTGGGSGTPATVASTITINVAAVNDDPELNAGSTMTATVDPGADYSVTLTPAMLQVDDTDSPDTELTFTITSLPSGNKLRIDGNTALIGSTFTMQDLRDGKVVFWQHLAAQAGDTNTFRFTVRDNALSLRWDTAGEDFQRSGGIYADTNPATPLSVLNFTINLAPIPGSVPNTDTPGTAPEIPAPAADPAQTLYIGDDTSRSDPGEVPLLEGGTRLILGADSDPGTMVSLRYTAEGVPSTQVVYTVTGFGGVTGGWNGTLQLDTTGGGAWTTLNLYSTFTQWELDQGRVRFVHDGGEDFESTVSYQVSAGGFDQATGEPKVTDGTLTIHVTPVNDAPTAAGSSDTLMLEGAEVVVVSDMLSFADADDATSETKWENGSIADSRALDNGQGGSDPLSFRVTQLPSHGTLWVKTGGVWTQVTQAMVDGGTAVYAASLITGDSATSGVKYVHDGLEDRADSFKVVARDRWNAESAAVTVAFTVTNVNDAPEFAANPAAADPTATGRSPNLIGPATGANTPLTVVEGGKGQISATLFQGYDPDSSDVQVQYRITTAPASGYLARSTDGGATLSKIGVGSAFTQKDVTDGYIYYVHDGSDTYQSSATGYSDRFVFTIADGDKEQTAREFHIDVTPANDAPTISGGPSGVKLVQSGTAVHNTITGITVGDTDVGTVANHDATHTAGVTDENSFMRAIVRLRDSSGTLLNDYSGVSIGYATGAGAGVVGSYGGVGTGLVLEGTLAQINAALAGLSVTFATDRDSRYTLEIIADDRNRTAGTLDDADTGTGGTQPRANGGLVNDGESAIPTSDPDPLTGDFGVSALAKNVAVKQVTLYASRTNDAPTVTYGGTPITPVEDTSVTVINGTDRRLVVQDQEAGDTGMPVRVTLVVSNGALTVGSRDGVTVTGNQSGSLQLEGKVADVQALLDAGVVYKGAADFNGDDTGIQVTLSDLGAVGDDDDDGTANTKTATLTIPLGDATDVNDKAALSIGSGKITVSGTGTVAVSMPALDSILSDVDDAAETGATVLATVRLLAADGTPLAQSAYAGITIGSGATAGMAVTGYDGVGNALVLRGTIDEIETALATLTLTFANAGGANDDTSYQLQVVIDDRSYDAAGALVDSDGGTGGVQATANGGALNQTNGADPTQSPAVVAATAIDPYATTNTDLDAVFNIVRAQRDVFVSGENDAAAVSASNVSVTEGSATVVLNASRGNLTIADPDDNGGTMTVTVTLDKGRITNVGGTATVTGGLGSASVTLSGTETQLNASLKALTVAFPGTSNTNWHGTITATVVVNDGGNTGGRPTTITGDTGNSAANPGDYAYADGVTAAMTTTRVFTITVTPENDRPTASGTAAIDPNLEDTTPTGTPLSTLLASRYSDATDNQATANSGGDTSSALTRVAIVGSTNYVLTQGTWQVSDGASGWIDIPASGLSAAAALVFTADRSIRFVPAANYQGVPGTLTLMLADGSGTVVGSTSATDYKNLSTNGGTGATGAWATGTVTVGTSVDNVNDRPTASAATLATVAEDTAEADITGDTVATIITTTPTKFGDATDNTTGITGGTDESTSFGGIAIVGNAADPATQGTWYYKNGSNAWVAIGSGAGAPSDTDAILLGTADRLRFVPVGDYNGTPGGLTVRYADSTVTFSAASDIATAAANTTGTWSATTTIGTSVSARNDAPILSGTAANPTISENAGVSTGSTAVKLLANGTAGVSDLDFADASFGGGTITVSLTDGYRSGDVLELGASFAVGIVSSVSGGNGAALVINLGAGATETNIAAVLQAIQYRSTSDNPTNYGNAADLTRAYRIAFNDGNNNAQAGGNGGGDPTLNAPTPITGTVTFTPDNDPPDAVNDTATLTEDTASVTGDARANDSDPDNPRSSLTVTAFSFGGTGGTVGSPLAGAYGALTLNPDGTYSYTLNTSDPAVQALRTSGTTLTETFTYTLSDGALTDTATIAITITGTNDAPVASADALAAVEDGAAVGGNVLTNDTDKDSGDTKTVTQVNGATGKVGTSVAGANGYGNFVIGSGGAVTYTIDNSKAAVQALAQGQTVTDTVTYQVTDADGGTSTATVTVTITGVNDTPDAVNNTASIAEDSATAATGNVLTNDTDVDTGATRTVTAVSLGGTGGTVNAPLTAAYGTLTLNADGGWSYSIDNTKPAVQALAVGQTLTETFTYTATDQHGASDTATLTITITGTNDDPVANADTGTIAEDTATPVTGDVLANDTDKDTANTHAVSAVSFGATSGTLGQGLAGSYGTLTLRTDGTWSYAVNNASAAVQALRTNGDTLTETFTYTNTDSSGGFSTNTLTITVTGVNDTPVANADALAAVEDGGAVNGTVLTNDTDVDSGDSKTVSQVNGAAGNVGAPVIGANGYGSFTISSGGAVSYTVNNGLTAIQALAAGETLTDTVTYQVRDTAGAVSTATVTVTITGVNDNPVANDDTGIVVANASSAITGTVLTNDTDVDTTNTHTVSAVSFGGTAGTVGQALNGAYGTLTLNANGTWSYAVNSGNAAVQAIGAGEQLTEIFTYTNRDSSGGTDTATLTVTITGANSDPVAVADTGSIAEDATTAATGTVLTNDTDVDTNDTHTVSAVSFDGTAGTVGQALNGSYGALTLNADGTWDYSIDNTKAAVQALPVGGTLTETFSYTNRDASGATSTSTLTITINGVNDAPVALADTGSIAEDSATAATGDVLANDTDVDTGATRSVTGIAFGATAGTVGSALNGAYGALTQNANGTWSYSIDNTKAAVQALAVGETLTETFTYTVADQHGATHTADLVVTISGTNDAPVSVADTGSIAEDSATAATGNVLTNDTDVDTTNTHTVTAVTFGATNGTVGGALTGAYGALTLNADGTWSYSIDNTKAAVQALAVGETLTEVFGYTNTDVSGGTANSTLTITIAGTNDAPTVTGTPRLTGAVTEDNGSTLTDTGTLAFADVDLTDAHTVSAAFAGTTGTTQLGALTVTKTADTTGTGTGGGVQWTYTVNNAAVQFLAAGQTVVESYTVTVSDGKGGTVSRTVAITITGTNDAPTVSGTPNLDGALVEDAASPTLSKSGSLAFTDVDLTDTHSVTATLTSSSAATPLGTMSATRTGTETQWTFSVENAAVQHLAAGQVVTQTYTLTISDGKSGAITRDVTVTITGTNDAPVIAASSDLSGAVTEDASSPTLTDSGALSFGDVDLTDAHAVSSSFVSTTGTAALGSLSVSKTADTTGTGTGGAVQWTYTVDNASVQYLAAGQTVTETYTVTVSDGNGGTDTRTLVMTITGTNDAPTVTGAPPEVAGRAGQPLSLTVDRNRFADVDLADSLGFTAGMADGSPLPSWLSFSAGSLTFSGTPPSGTAGSFVVVLRATDQPGASAALEVRFTITADPAATAPPPIPTPMPTTPPAVVTPPVTQPTPVAPLITVVGPTTATSGDPASGLMTTSGFGGTSTTSSNTGTLTTFVDGMALTGGSSTSQGFGADAVAAATALTRGSDSSGLLSTDAVFRQTTSANVELFLAGSVGNQVMLPNQQTAFQVPPNVFRHTNPGEKLAFQAAKPDGSPLPNWLQFDAQNMTFRGTPPAGVRGNVDVVVVAKDARGNQAAAQFRILVTQDLRTGTPVDDAQRQAGTRPGNAPPETAPPAEGGEAPRPQAQPEAQPQAQPQPPANPGPRADADVESFSGMPAGRQTFSAQLHAVGTPGLLAEARALLDTLLLAADTDRDAA